MRMQSSRSITRMRRRQGFSFIELLTVLVLMGLILAISVPRFAPMRSAAALRSSKQVVTAYLNTARQSAIRRGTASVFRVNGNTVSVGTTVNGVASSVEPPVNLLDRYAVTLTTALDTLQFNSRGFAQPRLAGSRVLRLTRGRNVDSLCVTALGMLGKCGL